MVNYKRNYFVNELRKVFKEIAKRDMVVAQNRLIEEVIALAEVSERTAKEWIKQASINLNTSDTQTALTMPRMADNEPNEAELEVIRTQ